MGPKKQQPFAIQVKRKDKDPDRYFVGYATHDGVQELGDFDSWQAAEEYRESCNRADAKVYGEYYFNQEQSPRPEDGYLRFAADADPGYAEAIERALGYIQPSPDAKAAEVIHMLLDRVGAPREYWVQDGDRVLSRHAGLAAAHAVANERRSALPGVTVVGVFQ